MSAAKKMPEVQDFQEGSVIAPVTTAVPVSRSESVSDIELREKLKSRVCGKPDSLLNSLLSFVANDKYDMAIKELRYFQQYMSQLGPFIGKTNRYFDHCEELILAIKAKKSFPNLDALPMAKRQDVFERVQAHFDQLQFTIKKIDQIEKEVHASDARSTAWVVQALIVGVTAIAFLAIIQEALKTMGLSFDLAFGDITNAITKIFKM